MIISSRVFQCIRDFSAQELIAKLEKTKIEDPVDNPETGKSTKLLTTVDEISINQKGDVLRGIMNYDVGFTNRQRDSKTRFTINTVSAKFAFFIGSMYFVPFVRRNASGTIASKMARIIMRDTRDAIIGCRISTSNIEKFLTQNPCTITSCWWAGINIPNLARAGLGGADIEQTQDFNRYNKHGFKKSVRFNLHQENWSILINEEACVVFYSNMTDEDINHFIRKRIIPLCS